LPDRAEPVGLCDIWIPSGDAGFAHGEMRLFAQTGELLAVPSQSILRASVAPQI
jgi:acyl-CoA thioesterase